MNFFIKTDIQKYYEAIYYEMRAHTYNKNGYERG